MNSHSRIFILWILFFNVSCAYHFGALDRSLPGGYTKIAVPVFKNSTGETGVETYFTSAMIEELERHGLADVTNEGESQVVVRGTIQSIRYEHGAFYSASNDANALPAGTVLAKEYYITVNAEVKLIRKSDQKVMWASNFTGRRLYQAPQITIKGLNSANALYNHSARLQNIATLAKELMEQAHNHMTENF